MMRLAPSKIYFSQDSISNTFKSDGSKYSNVFIGQTLDDLYEGSCSVESIPTISVCEINGKWTTADNRRLWVFRELQKLGKCDTVPVFKTYSIPRDKLTSNNGGTRVRVRRDPKSQYYNKSIPSIPSFTAPPAPVHSLGVTNYLPDSTSYFQLGDNTSAFSRPLSSTRSTTGDNSSVFGRHPSNTRSTTGDNSPVFGRHPSNTRSTTGDNSPAFGRPVSSTRSTTGDNSPVFGRHPSNTRSTTGDNSSAFGGPVSSTRSSTGDNPSAFGRPFSNTRSTTGDNSSVFGRPFSNTRSTTGDNTPVFGRHSSNTRSTTGDNTPVFGRPLSDTRSTTGDNTPAFGRPLSDTRSTTGDNTFKFGRSLSNTTHHTSQATSVRPHVATSSKVIVCAIDFGTTFSGWAYSFKDDYRTDPTKAFVRQWRAGNGSLCTEKTSTTALIYPDGKTLAAFGYGAEDEFKRLMETNDHTEYYLFRRFKMSLYKKLGEGITRDIMLKDELGKRLPAMDVFALSIKFLADDLKQNLRQRATQMIHSRNIHWVITVPAIWTDAAKQFMREAAAQAGISSDQLTLTLEPEAASLYCRYLTSDAVVGGGDDDDDVVNVRRPPPGSKYLIFDAGGGTVDITLHQVGDFNTLREVRPACGKDCGGTMVDKAFDELMLEILGDVYTEFRTNETDDFLDFQRDFEFKKREAGRLAKGYISIRIPPSLMELYWDETNQELGDALALSMSYTGSISLVRDTLRIKERFFEHLFQESVTNAMSEVDKILRNEDLEDLHAIYMVGGYSQSRILQQTMRNAYPTVNVVIPHDAAMCVLKGALIYGHHPTAISERVLKYTYGVDCRTEFNVDIHPISKKVITDKGVRCTDIFSAHARKGQTVDIGTVQSKHEYNSPLKHQKEVDITIFASDKTSPRFTDEAGCRKIGVLKLVFEQPYAVTYPSARVSLSFSGTEIIVDAEEVATGNKISSNMNFLG